LSAIGSTPDSSAVPPAGFPAPSLWPGPTRLLGYGLAALVVVLFVEHAFVCDDAFITFRVLDNFLSGYGLRWNVHERVQAYTHPLWLFVNLPAYQIIGEPFVAAIVTSFLANLALWALLWRRGRERLAAFCLAVVLPLVLSGSFLDYACSGLENPLTHVLLVGFWMLLLREGPCDNRRLLRLTLLAAFGAVNRLDTVLLFGPALLYAYLSLRPWSLRRVGAVLLGSLPLLAWLVGSLLYYGFALPNTYYAKLETGVAASDLWLQGFSYLMDLLQRDPVGLVLLVLGGVGACYALGCAAWARGRGFVEADAWARLGTLAAGGLLYAIYVLEVGGDFMAGRMWTAPILIGALVLEEALTWVLKPSPAIFRGAAVTALAAALWSIVAGTPSPESVPVWSHSGIVDERAFYLETNALVRFGRFGRPENHRFARAGLEAKEHARKTGSRTAYVATAIGMAGYYAGPDVILLDPYALADPLLARLPIPDPKDWRIGHYRRDLPPGYREAQLSGDPSRLPPDLAGYYRALRLIVAGDIFDPERLRAVWDFNLGHYDGYRERYLAAIRKP
jgi:arabinofuranosyltransferase